VIVVMPMAGRGERFRQAGFTLPKPLIPIDGEPMFVRATKSLPLGLATELVFAILEEHILQFSLDRLIQDHFGHLPLRIVTLKQVTSGQAETVQLATEKSAADAPLLVFNADSAFDDDLADYLPRLRPEVAGVVQVFRDRQPRWSFVRCDEQLRVVEAAEKRPISDLASTGLYYFRSLREYRELYRRLDLCNGETYIAPMYNQLVAQSVVVLAKPVQRYFCFGTPQDYEAYTQRGHVFT
jgi:NDP-sugar pyrophosphorylase family protein